MAFIRIEHPDIAGLRKTALTEAATASDTTLVVENIGGFSANDFLLLEGYGNSKSEIAQIANSAPSGSTITLVASNDTDYAHPIGTTVQYIPYDQMEIEYSTDFESNFTTLRDIDAANDAATWTNLTTIDIDVLSEYTTHHDTSLADRSYRTRFLNSNTGQYSPYSDPILPDGYEEFAVATIIRKALGRTNQKVSLEDSGLFSYEFLIDEINNCLREVHSTRKRWSWNQEFDHTLSELTAGQNAYTLPVNIDVDVSNRSFFAARINDGRNLQYVDKKRFDWLMQDVHESQLAAQLTSASSTITFDDTSDFDDSGTFVVITGSTKDTVEYSANNRSTNTLTLSSASTDVTTTHATDAYVWQGATFGTPTRYTVFEDSIYLHPIPDTGDYQRTLEIDYYKRLTSLNSVNDYVLFPDPMLVVHYLCASISIRQRNYEDIDRHRGLYQERLASLLRNEVTGQRKYFTLNLNTGGYPVHGKYRRIGFAANEGK